ncbi:isoleucine--tRNA ligase [Chlamydiifrater phoenicopteri]|uniref:isoleucine--tRNA ligase n=1 Tax=Chlamydiifrater phoenicopteri TaxID=2681469 RepID=UPI001BCD24DD|nr:isoleucine--tRNA ligase [Chlamydiifrater phoenicopteri]
MSSNSNRKEASVSDRELEILDFWKSSEIFLKSLEKRQNSPLFSFYDGPPFATGLPHYGHLLAGTIKDVVGRYASMKGFFVPRRFGWDCHGVPVEYEVEKTFKFDSPSSIQEFGIAAFNEECRKIVLKYVGEWQHFTERIGRWVDFSETWKTMDPSFMESVWWVFGQLYEKGLVYEGTKVVPFSTKLGTPLSNFEAGQNYKDVEDPSVVIKFPLKNDNASLLVWTTTPWTLVSNMGVAIGRDITYLRVLHKDSGQEFILGKGCLDRWFKEEAKLDVLEEIPGRSLEGASYEPPFSFFEEKRSEGAFRILLGDFVEETDGTGIVHMAPAFGEADHFLCKEKNVPSVCPLDNFGVFTEEVPDYAGLSFKEGSKKILKDLRDRDRLFYRGTIKHRYPFCWRTDEPLIYKEVKSWFVAVEKIKSELLASNEAISWVPGHIKNGRFGKWLEGARDWAISRNRYWGTPIPVWRSDDGDVIVVDSVKKLEELSGVFVEDLHRHFVDSIEIVADGKVYHRVSEVFDCWFDSGAMPYAQNHYPFDNAEKTRQAFPADFIAEGLDQTRGWFYTLTVISTALFGGPAFKNAIVNGLVLAEDGNKMSKRLSNYPSPKSILDKYGADALRLYLLSSVVVKGEDLKFSEKGVEGVLKQILIPLRSSLSFFQTYAKIYDFASMDFSKEKSFQQTDLWLFSAFQGLVDKVRKGLDSYDLNSAVQPLVEFVDSLTNWYIRRSRRRFWEAEDTADRRAAFYTLYNVLLDFSKLLAPFMPFVAEEVYLQLRKDSMPESVHLCDYPEVDFSAVDPRLDAMMDNVREVVSMGHSVRKQHKLKVRQPLPSIHIVGDKKRVADLLECKQLILEELNLKEAIFYDKLPDFVEVSAKPNYRELGKKVGSAMHFIKEFLETVSPEELKSLEKGERLNCLLPEGDSISLSLDDVIIQRNALPGYIAQNSDNFTLVLDTRLTQDLIFEGIARELVNKINTARKNLGLDVTDRIIVSIRALPEVFSAFEAFREYICNETLITECVFRDDEQADVYDINGYETGIVIRKA